MTSDWREWPPKPTKPKAPTPPKGKEGNPKYDLAVIDFYKALEEYKVELTAYRRAQVEYADLISSLPLKFLTGWIEIINGKPRHQYFKAGSDQENRARAELAKLLWNTDLEISGDIRWGLAALFNPDHATTQPRRLVFQSRHRGRQSNPTIDIEIARHVAREIKTGRLIKQAVGSAVERFGVEESTVRRAWKKYGDFAKKLAESGQ
jgi:hypothetical protein